MQALGLTDDTSQLSIPGLDVSHAQRPPTQPRKVDSNIGDDELREDEETNRYMVIHTREGAPLKKVSAHLKKKKGDFMSIWVIA